MHTFIPNHVWILKRLFFQDLQRLDGHDYSAVAYFIGEAHQAERKGASVCSIADKISGKCLTSD